MINDINKREFVADFCGPAIKGLKPRDAQRVAIALDAAIAFGALEYVEGNESLQNMQEVSAKYWDNVMRLKGL